EPLEITLARTEVGVFYRLRESYPMETPTEIRVAEIKVETWDRMQQQLGGSNRQPLPTVGSAYGDRHAAGASRGNVDSVMQHSGAPNQYPADPHQSGPAATRSPAVTLPPPPPPGDTHQRAPSGSEQQTGQLRFNAPPTHPSPVLGEPSDSGSHHPNRLPTAFTSAVEATLDTLAERVKTRKPTVGYMRETIRV
ncbi:unnamed protein product, partial [Ectocarpus fasciculatus]